MSENDYDLVLEELKYNSVDRLLMADVFDLPAFERLVDHLWAKADGLSAEHLLSKQILECIRSASRAIDGCAEYLPAAQEHQSLSGEFDLMLDMLIAGERREDRRPGIPRVI